MICRLNFSENVWQPRIQIGLFRWMPLAGASMQKLPLGVFHTSSLKHNCLQKPVQRRHNQNLGDNLSTVLLSSWQVDSEKQREARSDAGKAGAATHIGRICTKRAHECYQKTAHWQSPKQLHTGDQTIPNFRSPAHAQ